MRISKFIKAHRDILLEYTYDDGNNISEPYKILQNIRDNSLSYISGSASITKNSQSNQLVMLDPITNNFGLVNTTNYNFLQIRDFASGFPNRHDTITVHIPINWTFGEYLGFYIKAYAYDYTNEKIYALSNFFFDVTDTNQSNLLDFNAPPLLFQEKLWGKSVKIDIPSVYAISRQRVNNSARANTINSNLTAGSGLSITTPVFIDFHFIAAKRTINRITTYTLSAKIPISVPQAPDFENIGVMIQHSSAGDYFEIYGVFNGDINQFDDFINNSFAAGNRYYVAFTVTLFEQNIRGKSFTFTVTENFNEKLEYRPIIKYSTTTAIIDVEMNVIDAVDNSSIYRRASYGMLQDEVSKYSINLTKINLANANKPKIYNIKSPEGAGIFGQRTSGGAKKMEDIKPQVVLEPIKVNYAVLVDKFNVIAKSESVSFGSKNFFGIGKMELLLQPFDNIVKFVIAKDVSSAGTSNQLLINNSAPQYMDMSSMGDIRLIIRNDTLSFETGLYFQSNEINLVKGLVAFRIQASRMADIKKIAESGINLFYIVGTTDSGTTVIYSSLFKIYDSLSNVNNLRNNLAQSPEPYLILDTTPQSGIANVSRRTIGVQLPSNAVKSSTINTNPLVTNNTNQNNQNNQTSNTSNSTTSTPSATVVGKTTYSIGSDSSLTIDGYLFTNVDIKNATGLRSIPTNISFGSGNLYTNGMIIDNLERIYKRLVAVVITTPEKKTIFDQVQAEFRLNNPITNTQAVKNTVGAQVTTVGTQSVKLKEKKNTTQNNNQSFTPPPLPSDDDTKSVEEKTRGKLRDLKNKGKLK